MAKKSHTQNGENGRFPQNVRFNGHARFKTGDLATLESLFVLTISIFHRCDTWNFP